MPVYYKSEGEAEWSLYFGRNLQRMLHIHHITQQELARRMGSTDAMISRYIHGDAVPSTYKACQIAQAIGCEVSDLIKIVYDEY